MAELIMSSYRRAVVIVSDETTTVPQTLHVGGLNTGIHIISNEGGGVGGGVEVGVAVASLMKVR
jgi:hypothetical protein